jgi:chromosomal replication initiation ATPase DnaA
MNEDKEPLAVGLRGFKVREAIIPILKRYELPWSAVIKKRKYPQILSVRREAMLALRDQGMSLSQISNVFGCHHTTVLHGLRKYQEGNNA